MKVENATDLWTKTAQYTNPVLLHFHIIRPCCFRNGTSILQSGVQFASWPHFGGCSCHCGSSMDGVCTVRIPSMHLPRWHGHPPKWVRQIARGRIKTKLEQTRWSPLLQSSPSAIAEEAWTGYNVASPRFLCDGTGILQSGTGKLHRDWSFAKEGISQERN